MLKTVIMCLISLPFFILAAFLWFGKGSWLIAGYNTSSKEEKNQFDEKSLCRFTAKLIFVTALFMLILGFVKSLIAHLVLVVVFLIFIFGAVIYANTGNRFKKK